jgi:RNA polymerase sigma-70 factor (ECF subfamily)
VSESVLAGATHRLENRVSKELALDGAPLAPARGPTAAALFHEHAAFAWRVLRRLGVGDADVDDACQEVFLTVHRRLPFFEGRSSPRTWIYGICVRVASDHRRRAGARRETASARPPEGVVDAHQEDVVATRQARAELDRLLDSLDEDQRAAFVLYEIEELPLREVAAALGCPLQTAYSRLQAGRRSIEEALRRRRAKEERDA